MREGEGSRMSQTQGKQGVTENQTPKNSMETGGAYYK